MRSRDRIYNLRRRLFGSYIIDDPNPIAEGAPYTYFLPTENELLALQPGDAVKLVFRSRPPGLEWDAERMWVELSAVDGGLLQGTLDNDPFDMPQLKAGDVVSFRRADVIAIRWDEARASAPPPPSARRDYWDRCMVDSCVLAGRSLVDYLYREEPDMAQPDDKYPDSGWRIRGTDAGIAEDERQGESPQYVALGAVLNRDDSWLAFIDEPAGSRFIRDLQTHKFVVCEE